MINDTEIHPVVFEDLAEILAVQKVAFYAQAVLAEKFTIRPLMTTLEQIQAGFEKYIYRKAVRKGRIIGAIRGFEQEKTGYIENVIVLPEYQGQGVGSLMMQSIEGCFPQIKRFELFTARASLSNISFYEKSGYHIFREIPAGPTEPALVYMQKFRD